MTNEKYKIFKTLINESDPLVTAPITVLEDKLGIKRYTFSLLREFVKKDQVGGHTCWFKREHIVTLRKLLDSLEKELEIQEAFEKNALLERKSI